MKWLYVLLILLLASPVLGLAPKAEFTANETYVCVDEWVQFTDQSINNPTMWQWVMSPGGWDSHSQNPAHQFDTAGLYSVNLTASNADGTDFEYKVNYINVINCGGVWDDFPYCGSQSMFLRNDSSDISGYYNFEHRPEIAEEYARRVSVSSATGPQTIATFITPSGLPNVSVLAPGLWRFRMFHNVSSAVGVTTFEYIVLNRSLSGVETNLYYSKSITTDVDSLTPIEYLTSYARRNYTQFFPGDRIVLRVNASTTSVTARDAWVTIAGNSRASMVDMEYFLCPELVGTSSITYGSSTPDDIAIPVAASVIGAAIVGLILIRRKQ